MCGFRFHLPAFEIDSMVTGIVQAFSMDIAIDHKQVDPDFL